MKKLSKNEMIHLNGGDKVICPYCHQEFGFLLWLFYYDIHEKACGLADKHYSLLI